MDRITPLALLVSDLTNLDQYRAVELFRRLLWAEAAETGIGINLIDVPDCINVGDGGIDAVINDAHPSREDVIVQGTSGFQIKSSDLQPRDCRRELHQQRDLTQPIRTEVKRILDDGGYYILVLFADITDRQKRSREKDIKEELETLGYANSRVRVYTANQLAGFTERFPALVIWLKGNIGQFLPYTSWSGRRDVIMPRIFIADDERDKWIAGIRDKLRNPNEECSVFRVVGLPGIGKTRLVFEALSPDDLRNRVIYVTADQFRSSSLHITLQNDQNLSAIIVIDECDLDQHDEFVRSFSERGARLGVITLSYNMAKVPPPSLRYEINRLQTSKIEELIKAEAPQLPNDIASRLSSFADGYPRIALLLVESYSTQGFTPGDFFQISDESLMNHLIGGNLDIGSDHFRRTKKVLTGLSLFQKVGYERNLSSEAQWLSNYLSVPWGVFREVVAEQRQRGIIQGQYYIYVTPFMLRIHLLQQWWEQQGFTVESFNEFVGNIPEGFRSDLLKRFVDHIPYITTTERGQEFTEVILGEDGLFSDGSLIRSRLGSDFFLKLTEADPASSLACLKNTIGTWNKEELLSFTSGRRDTIWALEKIAIWRDLFLDAARLLLMLGEAENETISNNASGVFAGLFSSAPDPVAPTEASPQERFPIIEEAIESISKERRLLALNACDAALLSTHFSRVIGAEYQGLRRTPQLWMPKTYGEIFDSYRRVWQLIRAKIDGMEEDEQQKAVHILLSHARSLGANPNLFDMVIETLSELSAKTYVKKDSIVASIVQILHYDRKTIPPEMTQRWEELRDKLIGSDYSSLLRRYVGMDLLEDHFDDKGNHIDQAQPRIEELAQKSVENLGLLKTNLEWLVTSETQNSYRFGYELGKRDESFSLLPMLLDSLRIVEQSTNITFLGGYFLALFERDQQTWEKQLDTLMVDAKLNKLVFELTWRSGLTDRSILRVIDLTQKSPSTVAIRNFQMFARSIRELSEEVFGRLITFLLESEDYNATSAVLYLYDAYYFRGDSKYVLPEEPTLQVLSHESLFQNIDPTRRHTMEEFEWSIIAKAFVKKYPARSILLADKMLEHFGEEGTIANSYNSHAVSVLTEITQENPNDVWKLIVKYIGPPIDSRAFHITHWLRGQDPFSREVEGPLILIPFDNIWKWAEENVEKRARYLASFVPSRLFREKGKVCLAREVLCRYGDREDVQRSLMANFSTEGWSGPASLHHQTKKQQLLDFRKDEDNSNVKCWIDEYVASLDRQIKREKIEEEREG